MYRKSSIDVKGRLRKLSEAGAGLTYLSTASSVFYDNLMFIDAQMDKILAQTLVYFYKDGLTSCHDLLARLMQDNPLHYKNPSVYRYKFGQFLAAIALGMTPAKNWDGQEATKGGYILVTRLGEVLAYPLSHRDDFKAYLLNNTKYDTPSTKRHAFGQVYKKDAKTYLNLNLHIRFGLAKTAQT